MRRLNSNHFFFLTAFALGCGGAPSVATSTAASVDEAQALRPASDYFLPQTFAMARVDVAALRGLSIYPDVWPALSAHASAAERPAIAQLAALMDATDALWIAATPSSRHDPFSAVVFVARGRYDSAQVAAAVEALEGIGWQARPPAAGRPVLRFPDGFAATPDERTLLLAIGIGEGRLRALIDGASRQPGAVDGLLRLADARGFGQRTFEALSLPAGRVASEFNRDILGRHRAEGGVADAVSFSLDLGSGLRARLRVDVDSNASAARLSSHLGPEAVEGLRSGVTAFVPPLAPLVESIGFDVHGSAVTAHAAMTEAELAELLAFAHRALAASGEGAPVDVAAADPAAVREDLDMICREVTAMAQQGSAEERAALVAERVASQLRTAVVRQLWDVMPMADAGQRYELFRASAAEMGAPDYACPALEAWWAVGAATPTTTP